MADRTSPLLAWAPHFAALRGPVSLVEKPFRTHVNVRHNSTATSDRVRDVLGCPLPTTPCTMTAGGNTQALWLGPDEWLIIGDDQALVPRLRAAVDGHGSAIDVSAQRTTITVAGPGSRQVLAQGCAIDLDPRISPPGTCVQTLVALAGVILVVTDNAFELHVRSSFAGYLGDWLLDALTEFEGAH